MSEQKRMREALERIARHACEYNGWWSHNEAMKALAEQPAHGKRFAADDCNHCGGMGDILGEYPGHACPSCNGTGKADAPPAPSVQPAQGEAVAHVVPGVMRCAKCEFRLQRVNLYVGNGTVGAGDNKTEPCPNGCGPLWPVTWEQEARECWNLLEAQFEKLQVAKASSVPDDVAKDAARYRWLRDNPPCWMKHSGDIESGFAAELNRAIDAAMLAASAGTLEG